MAILQSLIDAGEVFIKFAADPVIQIGTAAVLSIAAVQAGLLNRKWLLSLFQTSDIESPRPEIEPISGAEVVRGPLTARVSYAWLGGAYPTTAACVQKFFDRRKFDRRRMWIAGVHWPVSMYHNKFVLITARPGVGKTSLMRLMIIDQAKLFSENDVKLRWLKIDPTGAFLPLLYQVLPPHVPIYRITPYDLLGLAWNLKADIGKDRDLVVTFVKSLFPHIDTATSEPFWGNTAAELCSRVLNALIELDGDWRLSDFCKMFAYQEFMHLLLKETQESRSWAETTLPDRQGQGVISTATVQVNQLAKAAAMMDHATGTYQFSGPSGILNQNCVVHLAFPTQAVASLSLFANLVVQVMTYHALGRNDEHDYTKVWVDEGKFAEALPIDLVNARGRGCGLSVILTAVGLPALKTKWGEARIKELEESVALLVGMASGSETAEHYQKHVGEMSVAETVETISVGGPNYRDGAWAAFFDALFTSGRHQGWHRSESTTVTRKTLPRLIPADMTNLPQGNSKADELHARVWCADVGEFKTVFPFRHAYENLPPSPVQGIVERPHEQRILKPFTAADMLRLNIELTEEVIKALKKYDRN